MAYEPQLFNLAEDPGEQVDLAQDPAYQTIRAALTARVLEGWDPAEIKAKMAAKRADAQILTTWAKQTQPPDSIRWPLRPEMNYLESG